MGLSVLLVIAGSLFSLTAPGPTPREAAGVQPIALRSHVVKADSFQRVAEVSGLLEARREVELFAEAEGKVIEVGAEELDHVEVGQLLLRMDPLLAEIEITQAEANLSRARSELRLAVANLKRQNSLRGNSVASEAAYDVALNQAGIAKASRKEALARLERARDALQKKVLVAPFAGELVAFPVSRGEFVRRGERVAELLEVDRLRITVGLSDREIGAVRVGAGVRVEVDAHTGEPFEGQIRRVGGARDDRTRKFPLQIEIDNSDGRLLPGMVARVRLELGSPATRIAIPREAVESSYGVDSVFVLMQDGKGGWRAARRRVEVRPIPFHPVEIEVVEGLVAGERVAISAVQQLADGSPVVLQGSEGEMGVHAVVQRRRDASPQPSPRRGGGG